MKTAVLTCYLKSLTPLSIRVDYEKHTQHFDFRSRIHANNRKPIAKMRPSVVADVAAAVLAHLQESGYVRQELYRDALEFCHDAILDMGYEMAVTRDLVGDLPPDTSCSMLLFGCQDREILRARVEAAYAVILELQRPLIVVFSGLNPATDASGAKTGKVRTMNESREMHVILE